LSAINIYYDPVVMRLNTDERGDLLGAFKEDDKIISVYKNGNYRITGFDLSTHFEDNLSIIQKFNSQKTITAIYENKEDGKFYMKRFIPELTDKKIEFLGDEKNIRPIFINYDHFPQIEVEYYEKKPEEAEKTIISCNDFVEIMSIKARGKRIGFKNIIAVNPLESLPEPEEEEIIQDEEIEEKGERRKEKGEGPEETLVAESNEEVAINEELAEEISTVLEIPKVVEEVIEEKIPEEPEKQINPTKEDEEWEQLTLF